MNFLDLKINVDQDLNKLNFDFYTKPTNAGRFLFKRSAHPPHIFEEYTQITSSK